MGYVREVVFVPTQHPVRHRRVLVVLAAASLSAAAGCGSADETAAPPATADPAPTSTDVAPTSSDAPSDPTTTASETTTTTATTATTNTVTTTSPEITGSLEVPIPAGRFDVRPTDLFVLQRNGDLQLWSGALSETAGPRTLIADYPDPFDVFAEGTGPNVIDHVAGDVGGAIVFGDCCEPIGGSLLAATDPGDVAPIAGGYSPTLSPSGDLLGTANDFLITQTSTGGEGSGVYRMINNDTETPYLNVADLTWSAGATTTTDDDHLVLLGWTDDGWWLHDVDRSTLEFTPTMPLGIPPIPEAPDTDVRFAGHGPDGEIAVAERSPDGTRLRFFAPTTLAEMPLQERSLPGSATSIRVADDGVGLLWVDGGTLYHLPAGELEATALGSDVLAAWYAPQAS